MVGVRGSVRLFAVLVLMVVCGCGSKGRAPVGFLSDYSRLQAVSDTTLRYVGPKNELGSYSKFIIDPVAVHFHDEGKSADISSKELAELRRHMYAAVHNAILDSYDIVRKPGPGVARIRIALTDVDKSSVVLKTLPATMISGVGLGGASMEAELIDSLTGKQIAAVIESQKGKRRPLKGLSKWGDAKAIMKDWAKRLKERLDEAHKP